MGFFRYVSNSVEGDLCLEYKTVLPSIQKISEQGRYDELMAAFMISIFGFKEKCENRSPNGERDFLNSTRYSATKGIKDNMFDSTVIWLTAAYISHLSSVERLTVDTLAPLKSKFFLPAFERFESGSLSQHLPPAFAALTREQRRNVLAALGSWKPS